jgi:hypothetical protein
MAGDEVQSRAWHLGLRIVLVPYTVEIAYGASDPPRSPQALLC